MRLLLVEDDPSLASGIRIALKPEHYTVDHLTDGESALNALQSEPFDAVILDLGLPNVDGIEVLRTIRRHGNHVPILVLTARDAVDHRIEGLDSGADDYLTKPFEVDELKARLRALLRRSQGHTNDVLRFRGISLDPQSMIVTYQHQTVPLSRRELALLQEFMSHPGRVFTRDTLTRLIYGWEEEVESNAIEVHIHHLRRKLFPDVVRTVRGIGYVMDKPEQVAP